MQADQEIIRMPVWSGFRPQASGFWRLTGWSVVCSPCLYPIKIVANFDQLLSRRAQRDADTIAARTVTSVEGLATELRKHLERLASSPAVESDAARPGSNGR